MIWSIGLNRQYIEIYVTKPSDQDNSRALFCRDSQAVTSFADKQSLDSPQSKANYHTSMKETLS